MTKLPRSEFIKTTAMALVSVALVPKFLLGKDVSFALPEAESTDPPRAKEPISEFGIVDLHCHPSLKMYLWDKKIWKHSHSSPGMNLLSMQYTVEELASGNVKGFLNAHYLPEAALTRESANLKKLLPWIKRFCANFAAKVEHEDSTNITQIYGMMKLLEEQVDIANQKQDKVKLVIAKDFKKFEDTIKESNIPVVHAIEGAHALGRNFPITRKGNQVPREKKQPDCEKGCAVPLDPKPFLDNLEKLAERGVCLMSLGHFFRNDIVFPPEGISPDGKNLLQFFWEYTPDQNLPLTDIGKIVVAKMLDIGMIVDLTHSTPRARKDVFDLNWARRDEGKKMRPLTFTHTGAKCIFEKYEVCNQNAYDNYKFYDACDEEIDWISECEGTIGIIPENFWLIGCDPALNKGKYKDGIDYIVETIRYINSKTRKKEYDNISIGTDFDGLADAPRDLYKPSQLNRLTDALCKSIGPDNTKKITSGNALRLLRDGWGTAT
ncbi:MAG TPA: membrane dipeptidase [Pyrinomonadaceae bacterium]|nr:membrane dipeptidase [Pyrinomonadaceae bacterium]